MVVLDGASLELDHLVAVARGRETVTVDPAARIRMERSRDWVLQAEHIDEPIYGVNTGFGSLARVRIDPSRSSELSTNLVRSHAAGVGAPFPVDVVRVTMLLRANALTRGVSGCQVGIVDGLVALLNHHITPVVPSQGSCGSSGDLAPLSHIGLVLMEGNHGEVWVDGQREPASVALKRAGIARLRLGAKDGLAITNGAQATTALLALALHDATVLLEAAEVAAAMSIEAMLGVTRAFHPAVHQQRPYRGAQATAGHLCALLEGSGLTDTVPGKVQDAYSLRCTPVVLGAVRDALVHVHHQLLVELNAVTDNPLILLEEPGVNKAFSAGLFHGEPMGMAADYLKIAVSEIASLSERRLYRLTTGTLSQRLPPGLADVDRPELGMLLPQTTAAALVSEIRSLGWPASIDSIPTCEDQEDHVAMSTTAARRGAEVVDCARRVVAAELLGATMALCHRQREAPDRPLGRGTRVALEITKPAIDHPTPAKRIAALEAAIASGALGAGLHQAGFVPEVPQ